MDAEGARSSTSYKRKTEHLRAYIKIKTCKVGGPTSTSALGCSAFPLYKVVVGG